MYSLFGNDRQGRGLQLYFRGNQHSSQIQKDRGESPVSLGTLIRKEDNKSSDTAQHPLQMTTSGKKASWIKISSWIVSHTAESAGKQKDPATQMLLKHKHHRPLSISLVCERKRSWQMWFGHEMERNWVLSLPERSPEWSGLTQAHQLLAGLPHTGASASALWLSQPRAAKSSSTQVWWGQ